MKGSGTWSGLITMDDLGMRLELDHIGLLSESSRTELLSLRSDIWGSSYTTTLFLLPGHIPPQFWSTLQGAFAVLRQSLLLANLKFHCFEAE